MEIQQKTTCKIGIIIENTKYPKKKFPQLLKIQSQKEFVLNFFKEYNFENIK